MGASLTLMSGDDRSIEVSLVSHDKGGFGLGPGACVSVVTFVCVCVFFFLVYVCVLCLCVSVCVCAPWSYIFSVRSETYTRALGLSGWKICGS